MENLEEKIKEKVEELKESKLPFLILENVNEKDLSFAMKKNYIISREKGMLFSLIMSFFSLALVGQNLFEKQSLDGLIFIPSMIIFGYFITFSISSILWLNTIYDFQSGKSFILGAKGMIYSNKLIKFLTKIEPEEVLKHYYDKFGIVGTERILEQKGEAIGENILKIKEKEQLKKYLNTYYKSFGKNAFYIDSEAKQNINFKSSYINKISNSVKKIFVGDGKKLGMNLFKGLGIFIIFNLFLYIIISDKKEIIDFYKFIIFSIIMFLVLFNYTITKFSISLFLYIYSYFIKIYLDLFGN